MDYLKVTGHDGLVRDNRTGAIINTDKSAFEIARKSRLSASSFNQIQQDVQLLKDELYDIKNLLRELLKNGS
jgi:hypothetical protein